MAIPHTAPDTKATLARLDIKPNRRLGQNFLVDERVRDRVIAAAGIRPDETILEIGPGLGALTEALAQRTQQVVAVEKDGRLVDFLTERFAGMPNVAIVNSDVRRVDLVKLVNGDERSGVRGAKPRTEGASPLAREWSVIANPPYYLAPFLIRTLLGQENPPRQITLVVQREIADRLAAGVGEMNLLALMAQLASRITKHDRISRRAFWPQPEVDSTIITLVAHPEGNRPIQRAEEHAFFEFARPIFRGKRKQILGSLSRSLTIPAAQVSTTLKDLGIAPATRPEAISVDKWVALFRAFTANRV